MCGIIGIIGNHQFTDILTLREKISHRGPDGLGIYHDEVISLGHTRLAVLDPTSKGNQPMVSEDENYAIVFNGEVYNHWEIRKKLIDKYKFQSHTDTETLLYGFIEYGTDILKKLKGIFAFAVYNKKTGNVFIARDQFGVKPLYYYSKGNVFLFGSEIKSLIDFPGFDKSITAKAFVNYLYFGWSPGELTPFTHVKKLLPGHYIELNLENPQKFNLVKYYEISFSGNYDSKTEEVLMDELEEKLTAAVRRQLLSDVPIGFFLSGGLDSSALVAIARKILPDKKIQCFTVSTKGLQEKEGFSDDLHYAKKVASHLQVDLEVVESDGNYLENFDKIIYHLDEPQADSAPFNLLDISRRAKEMGYKVLISGAGGDDIFSGYRRHQALYYEKYFRFIPGFLLKIFRHLLKAVKIKTPSVRRIKKVFMNDVSQKDSRLASYYSLLPINRNRNLFSEKYKKEIASFDPSMFLKKVRYNIPDEYSDLNKMLYWEIKTYLPDHNLNYTDKIGMMQGVEIRVPFLDKELVQFSTRIPPHLKMKGITTKYLLRKLMERYLPKEVIYRSKTGFGIPPSQLLSKELEPKIKEYLSCEAIQRRGVFNPQKVQTLLVDHSSGYIDASYPILCLMAIESWFRQFVDEKIVISP